MISQWILGIRPEFDGLAVNPCIPSDMEEYKVTRAFRGAIYEITVRNPDHVCRGVKSCTVDGKSVGGNLLPVLAPGTYTVEVILG